MSIGLAVHITAASPGGPRYDPALSAEDRSSFENAIWLCQSCSILMDRDPAHFTVRALKDFKSRAEREAAARIVVRSNFRQITTGEIFQVHSLADRLALKAMNHEFGCEILTEIGVQATDGSHVNFRGAVVRGEDLVAIENYESKGNGFRFFEIENLTELGRQVKFERFNKLVLFIVVVSSATEEDDSEVR